MYDTQADYIPVVITALLDMSFADPSKEGAQGGRNRIFFVSAGMPEDGEEDDLDGRPTAEDIT